jgi:ParB family transcriptional regulator, chromosome partitioning protein
MTTGDFVRIGIGQIEPAPRPRESNGDLTSMVASIRKVGLLHPVIVDRRNRLIAGGRRLEACRIAGLAEVPAFRVDVDADSMAGLSIQADENLCRLGLTQAELDRHIRMKTATMRRGKSFWLRALDAVRGFFSRSETE